MSTTAATAPSSADTRQQLLQQLSHAQQTLNYSQMGKTALQIVRFYIKQSHYAQAQMFIENTTFPQADQIDALTFNYYKYYMALINAIFLQYDQSLSTLQLIVRSGEEDITPFHIHVYRLYIIVSLLTGTIPERSLFSIPLVLNNLQPSYLALTQAVRRGDTAAYKAIIAVQENVDDFINDNTYNLILRLQPTILRAGLKRIISVYSAISLQRIGELLSISDEDVHSIVAKAISDQVITATIDESNIVHSISTTPQYASADPQIDLVNRINTVMNLRQQCQQSLRFPDRQTNLTTVDGTKENKHGADLLL